MNQRKNFHRYWILPVLWIAQRAFVLLAIFACVEPVTAQSLHQSLRKGDHAYDRENYKAAEKQYRIAAELDYANPKALYNLGNSLYQQGNWEDAGKRYDLAAKNTASKTELADALHNLGNASLKQRKYKDAVEAFENSLRFRPGDADSKINLQMAKKMLQEEQKKEQEKQQQNPEQPKEDKQDDQQQPQNQQDKQQQDNQQQQQQNQAQKNQSGQPQQPDQQQEQAPPGKMKKEEAQRMLETAVGPEDQRNARKYRSAQQKNKPKTTKKDW